MGSKSLTGKCHFLMSAWISLSLYLTLYFPSQKLYWVATWCDLSQARMNRCERLQINESEEKCFVSVWFNADFLPWLHPRGLRLDVFCAVGCRQKLFPMTWEWKQFFSDALECWDNFCNDRGLGMFSGLWRFQDVQWETHRWCLRYLESARTSWVLCEQVQQWIC